jgi:hypothetical protein
MAILSMAIESTWMDTYATVMVEPVKMLKLVGSQAQSRTPLQVELTIIVQK